MLNNDTTTPLTTNELYEIAKREHIEVYDYPFRECFSMSVCDEDGNCTIGLRRRMPRALKRTCLAHEIGHCVTGSFYNRYAAASVRGKCEYKADKWAFCHIVPKDRLHKAMQSGYTEPWQLAEYFCVTDDFMMDALAYYAGVEEMK